MGPKTSSAPRARAHASKRAKSAASAPSCWLSQQPKKATGRPSTRRLGWKKPATRAEPGSHQVAASPWANQGFESSKARASDSASSGIQSGSAA